MKFMDIATSSGSVAYFADSSGAVNPEKFLKYWFLDFEKIIHEIALAYVPEKKFT